MKFSRKIFFVITSITIIFFFIVYYFMRNKSGGDIAVGVFNLIFQSILNIVLLIILEKKVINLIFLIFNFFLFVLLFKIFCY
jgi:hypothetical protein